MMNQIFVRLVGLSLVTSVVVPASSVAAQQVSTPDRAAIARLAVEETLALQPAYRMSLLERAAFCDPGESCSGPLKGDHPELVLAALDRGAPDRRTNMRLTGVCPPTSQSLACPESVRRPVLGISEVRVAGELLQVTVFLVGWEGSSAGSRLKASYTHSYMRDADSPDGFRWVRSTKISY